MMPYFGHVLPILYYAVVDGMRQSQHTTLGLSLLPDIGLFLIHADHDGGHFGFTDHSVKLGAGRILPCQSHLAASRTIVDHYTRLVHSVYSYNFCLNLND